MYQIAWYDENTSLYNHQVDNLAQNSRHTCGRNDTARNKNNYDCQKSIPQIAAGEKTGVSHHVTQV